MDTPLIILSLVSVGLVVIAMYLALKNRMTRIEQKLSLLIRHHGLDEAAGSGLSERVKQLARDPLRKLDAVRVYREETGSSLAEAKQAVETYINSL